MKIFLTGATGYIGNCLTRALAKKKHEVNILVRELKSNRIPDIENVIIHKGDLYDYNSIYKAMKGCDYVFHAAAFTDLKCNEVDKFYNTNVLGTENVLECALKHLSLIHI